MASPRVRQILLEVLTDPPGRASTAAQVMQRLVAATLAAVKVDGASVALMTPAGHAGLLAATDGPSAELENLQLTLGEGPCLDASRAGRPVLQPDLSSGGTSRWPGFTSSATNAGIAAVFAFPLQVGAIRLGVLDLYRTITGSLEPLQLAEALDFAAAATTILLDLQHSAPIGELHPLLAVAADGHREIHQATGMISVQAAIGLTEALLLLRARAYAAERPLLEVANDVLNRRLTFYPEDDHDE
ncbi:GAF and ANTAR domain-containing protein [Kribbella jiaozuonensis]|uniref:GAF and ANTAR domain-containing protein n=1 Tax=Kribbella jiaozuonensis TaxID=2575441 RepID=A0A4U3M2F5_9ACTN|nr:GAF and ANTAR domain-containing protein [Kribbella jiaozuonensis]TKK82219.1 GAF and ANTAR domain-containing protein [Kribbella jiaozuonensis]